MKKIKVIVAGTVEGDVRTLEVPNTLESLQELVEGYIEHTTLPELTAKGIHLLVNEEGLLAGLDGNENLFPFFYVGNVVFLCTAGEDFTGLSESQLQFVYEWLEGLS